MQTNAEAQRQLLGCGFLPPPEQSKRRHVRLWQGGSLPNYKGPETTVCPGYSTTLPEVIEVVRAHRHWSKGNLPVADREPADPFVAAIEILDSALGEFQSWGMTSEKDGGGRAER
jgi:hypothetical protein